jgi:Carboxypeptidase regulatory-like domain/Putative binding domain, N-terminal
MPSALKVLAAAVVGAIVSSGCDKSPATPTPPPAPTTHTVVVVASTKVAGERRAEGGYVYRTVLHLTETAGVTANIAAVNLTFLNGTTALLTARFDAVVPSTGNTCPARSSVDTRELVATDTTATNAFATTVRVEVTYGDATSTGMTANATADVPPLGPPPPSRYTLTGRISDPGSVGIPNARVEVLNGDNAGKVTTTDGSGTYTLTELLGGAFRLRASADGYNTGEQNVTVPDVPRADFTLQRSTAACAYDVSATGRITVGDLAGQFGVTLTRTSGSCSWQATTDADWLTPRNSSGDGAASLTFSYASNPTFVGRLGTITFSWAGGSAQLQVSQNPQPVIFCVATLTVNGQNPLDNVPAAGGTYAANLVPAPGMPSGFCGSWTASASGPITIVGPTSGPALPASINFTVAANPSSTPRSGSIGAQLQPGGHGASLTVNQVAGP